MSNDITDLSKKIDVRFDDIEKLLQLLLINNLVQDVDEIVKIFDGGIVSELQNIMDKYHVQCKGFQTVNYIEVLCVEIPEGIKLKIQDLNDVWLAMRKYYPNEEPLFIFKKIHGNQKKALLKNKISFGVKGEELHITSKKLLDESNSIGRIEKIICKQLWY